MLDGFWILRIQPPPVASGGVAVLINGKIFGGDAGFTWVGTYTADARMVKARIHVRNFDPDIQSAFGIQGDYDMHISGNIDGTVVTGTAMVANQPQHSVAFRLEKRADL